MQVVLAERAQTSLWLAPSSLVARWEPNGVALTVLIMVVSLTLASHVELPEAQERIRFLRPALVAPALPVSHHRRVWARRATAARSAWAGRPASRLASFPRMNMRAGADGPFPPSCKKSPA